MKTEHYPSLELYRRLTKIGFPTTFQHIGDSGGTVIGCSEIPEGMYVSPSVMEMLDVMPELLNIQSLDERFPNSYLDISLRSGYWTVLYGGRGTEDKQLPNALAEMILWLHENNYISFNK